MSERSRFLRGDVGLHQSSVKRVDYCLVRLFWRWALLSIEEAGGRPSWLFGQRRHYT